MFVGVGDRSDGSSRPFGAEPSTARTARSCGSTRTARRRSTTRATTARTRLRAEVSLYGSSTRSASRTPGTDRIVFGSIRWSTWERGDVGLQAPDYGWPCYGAVDPRRLSRATRRVCAARHAHRRPFHTYDHGVGGGPRSADSNRTRTRSSIRATSSSRRTLGRLHQADRVRRRRGARRNVQPFAPNVPAPVSMVDRLRMADLYLSFTTGDSPDPVDGAAGPGHRDPDAAACPRSPSTSRAPVEEPGGRAITYRTSVTAPTSTAANPDPHLHVGDPAHPRPTLTVTNSEGHSASRTLSVTVGSMPPTPDHAPPRSTAPRCRTGRA